MGRTTSLSGQFTEVLQELAGFNLPEAFLLIIIGSPEFP